MLSGLMITGIGVMLTIPIRVEYLVNPAYELRFQQHYCSLHYYGSSAYHRCWQYTGLGLGL